MDSTGTVGPQMITVHVTLVSPKVDSIYLSKWGKALPFKSCSRSIRPPGHLLSLALYYTMVGKSLLQVLVTLAWWSLRTSLKKWTRTWIQIMIKMERMKRKRRCRNVVVEALATLSWCSPKKNTTSYSRGHALGWCQNSSNHYSSPMWRRKPLGIRRCTKTSKVTFKTSLINFSHTSLGSYLISSGGRNSVAFSQSSCILIGIIARSCQSSQTPSQKMTQRRCPSLPNSTSLFVGTPCTSTLSKLSKGSSSSLSSPSCSSGLPPSRRPFSRPRPRSKPRVPTTASGLWKTSRNSRARLFLHSSQTRHQRRLHSIWDSLARYSRIRIIKVRALWQQHPCEL